MDESEEIPGEAPFGDLVLTEATNSIKSRVTGAYYLVRAPYISEVAFTFLVCMEFVVQITLEDVIKTYTTCV